jgi:hypothetical protein
MSKADFGASHIPGYLPRPDPQDAAAASTPAQSGMGPLVAPRLYPRSCCPPAWQEPLTAPADADAADIIAARQAEREALDESDLMNRLVYDSLQPPVPAKERENGAGACGWSSSCRTTASSKSLNACEGDVSAGDSQAAERSSPEHKQQELQQSEVSHAYAPGLAPWYVPEGSSDTTLVFESRFESGNLRRAIQVSPPLVCSMLQRARSCVVCCQRHLPTTVAVACKPVAKRPALPRGLRCAVRQLYPEASHPQLGGRRHCLPCLALSCRSQSTSMTSSCSQTSTHAVTHSGSSLQWPTRVLGCRTA